MAGMTFFVIADGIFFFFNIVVCSSSSSDDDDDDNDDDSDGSRVSSSSSSSSSRRSRFRPVLDPNTGWIPASKFRVIFEASSLANADK
jgi:hypothetical protein